MIFSLIPVHTYFPVDRSQPAIGHRVKKLEEYGLLNYQAGINLRNSQYLIAKIQLEAKDPKAILTIARKCPYMLTAFKLSGLMNINIIAYGQTTSFLEELINYHLRSRLDVRKIEYEFMTEIINDIVLPLDIYYEKCECVQTKRCENT